MKSALSPLSLRVPWGRSLLLRLAVTVSIFLDTASATIGRDLYGDAVDHFERGNYMDAAPLYWKSILAWKEENEVYGALGAGYKLDEAYRGFMSCYQQVGRPADGFAFVANEYLQRGSMSEAKSYADVALKMDPNNSDALAVRRLLPSEYKDNEEDGGVDDDDNKDATFVPCESSRESSPGVSPPTSAAAWYDEGTVCFSEKKMGKAATAFGKACELSKKQLYQACINEVYCRTNIADWGEDGRGYEEGMVAVRTMVRQELKTFRSEKPSDDNRNLFTTNWSRFSSCHPHMMLGFSMVDEEGNDDMLLKKLVAESYAQTDVFYGLAEVHGQDGWRDVMEKGPSAPPNFPSPSSFSINQKWPVDQKELLDWHRSNHAAAGGRIKIAYLCVGVNSKAVMFLAQDIFRYHDRKKFEVHVLSTGDPDGNLFVEVTMRGVDWRARVKNYVEYFHDCRSQRAGGPTVLAQYVLDLGIHVLVDWDGYARQGQRAQGLNWLRPAPVQIMHQEFLGTSGGNFDYIVTDSTVSPLHLEDMYAEKFMYMPHHFFCKGHRVQSEVIPPALEYLPRADPNKFVLGTGSPNENMCNLQYNPDASTEVSFVYCNFNKFLKFSPTLVKTWLKILKDVPDSIMCLLTYPMEGVPNLLEFVASVDPSMVDRVGFLPWENNPFDHQRRSRDYCNVGLDTHPYNGHTTSMDALYAGVPIVTRSDGDDMASRVVTSANRILNLTELNAEGGLEDYYKIAVRLGTEPEFYNSVRERLVATALSGDVETGDGIHPFWDMKRYTRNFESGIEEAWNRYLRGEEPDHIFIRDVYDIDDDKSRSGSEEL